VDGGKWKDYIGEGVSAENIEDLFFV